MTTTTAPPPTPAEVDTSGLAASRRWATYGSLISWVLIGAFTISVAHTVHSDLWGVPDPDFELRDPTVWVFYALGFGSAALARRSRRGIQVGVLAYLVVLLAVAMLYYPDTFTEERQTTFGWVENDVYVGLLMTAAVLTVLRLADVVIGEAEPEESAGGIPDVHDMVVVHRAFRRELRLAPELVRTVPPGDAARAQVVADHVRLVLTGLHLHHTGEDTHLWPLLLERADTDHLVHRMEDQHAGVAEVLERVEPMLDRWEAEARPVVGSELAAALDELWEALVVHLDEEEQQILPLAALHLSQQEWAALGEAGVSKMTKEQLPIMFGMVLEDADADEQAEMLGLLPGPVRLLVRTVGARRYARYVRSVREGR